MNTNSITPGYGFRDLHLGMSAVELTERYGKPNRRRRASALREYWVYDDFNCIMSRKTRKMLSLFVEAEATSALGEDIAPWTEQTVRRKMGEPELEGGDFALSDTEYIDRWIIFSSGIGFRFDRSLRVTLLMIFRKRRATTRKPVGSTLTLATAA